MIFLLPIGLSHIGFIQNLSYMALLTFIVTSALKNLGIPMTEVTVVIGAAGLAIGFALQGSLSNFAAGMTTERLG